MFYWITITFSQTQGTARGDWATNGGLGFGGGAALFGVALALLLASYLATTVSHVLLFILALEKPVHDTRSSMDHGSRRGFEGQIGMILARI